MKLYNDGSYLLPITQREIVHREDWRRMIKVQTMNTGDLLYWLDDLDKELSINDAQEQETQDAGMIAELRKESRYIDAIRATVLEELAKRDIKEEAGDE